MPPIFKALTSITAWTLFITGWISLIGGYVRLFAVYGGATFPAGAPPVQMALAGGFVGLALSAAVMKLRHMLE